MKKTSTPRGFKFSSLFCNIFGHHYVVTKEVTGHIKEYTCLHCQKKVTTDVNGKLALLTPEMQEINETVADMYRKRKERVVRNVA